MKRILCSIGAIVGLLTLSISLHAHPGHDHPPDQRTWKDIDGLFEIEASFVLARDDNVQLCKHDGSLIWVPLAKLSREDQAWVRKKVEAIRNLNSSTVPKPTAKIASPPAPTANEAEGTDLSPALASGAVVVFAVFALLLRRKPASVPAVVVLLGSVAFLTVVAAPQAQDDKKTVPAIQKHFEPFKDKLELRSDDDYLYVGSNGFPDHPMMIGIKAWQQQVPLPQPYTGKNAWQIPLHPKLADKPISTKKALYRGAIALAINGVPIFNALNNRGEDAYLAGELDEYGGHCGRGDDYHYHMAPVHLEKTVGKGNPIAYALDGFPLFGYTDAGGKEPKDLDEFNGRMEKDGYRYYSTKKYPYINGGMRGEVTVRNDGIEPQPRDAPIRPPGQPLRGAKITDFTRDDVKQTYTLKYDLRGQSFSWKYTINKDSTYSFVFTDGDGKETAETYRRRERKDGPPPKKDGPPPKPEQQSTAKPAKADKFTVTSPVFERGGKFPIEFTGDGDGVSPPLAWSGAPEGTKFYALQLWHKPFPDRDEVKSYWVITNIPATVTSIPKNAKDVGKNGYNDKNRTGYDPMKSKGPGVKEYHITVYALSAEPKFTGDKVTRADLLTAIKDITLAESTLSYKYERSAK